MNKLKNKLVRKSVDIPEPEYKKLVILALESGMSLKRYIEEILLDALSEKENFKIVKV